MAARTWPEPSTSYRPDARFPASCRPRPPCPAPARSSPTKVLRPRRRCRRPPEYPGSGSGFPAHISRRRPECSPSGPVARVHRARSTERSGDRRLPWHSRNSESRRLRTGLAQDMPDRPKQHSRTRPMTDREAVRLRPAIANMSSSHRPAPVANRQKSSGHQDRPHPRP